MFYKRRHPEITEAVQWFRHGDHPEVIQGRRPEEGLLKTMFADQPVTSGCYIITNSFGDCHCWDQETFELTFERVDPSEARFQG